MVSEEIGEKDRNSLPPLRCGRHRPGVGQYTRHEGQDDDEVMERGGFAAFLFCFATFESLAWLDLGVSRINSNNVHNNRLSLCVFFCISSSSAYDRPSRPIAKPGSQPSPHRFFLLFLLVSSPMVAFLIASFTQF